MQFKLTGAKKDTGEDVVRFYHNADSAEQIREAVQREGIVIESIAPIAEPENTPYFAVKACGTILFVCGWISIVGGVVSGIAALDASNSFGGESRSTVLFASAITLALVGIFQLGAGSLLHMLRDTAIHIQSK